MTYDTQAAERVLRRLAAMADGDTAKEYAAGVALIREFAALPKPPEMQRLEYRDTSQALEFSIKQGPSRRVWYHARDRAFVISDLDQEKVHKLDAAIAYDPASDSFVGLEDDPDVTPIPGAKRQKRDALVVVIDAVMRHMRSEMTSTARR